MCVCVGERERELGFAGKRKKSVGKCNKLVRPVVKQGGQREGEGERVSERGKRVVSILL